MNGTGKIGLSLDPLASQILVVNFEWLEVGRIRCGFVVDGIPIYVHEFNHANEVAGVYMSTPNLPLRYEIENDGTGDAASVEHICATVVSEGGQNELGSLNYHSNQSTHVDANVAGTIYAILGMRLRTDHQGSTVKFLKQTMINQTNDDFEWMLIFNPTVAGTFTFADQASSALQVGVGTTANTVTGGLKVDGGYVKSSGSTGSISEPINSARLLGEAIDGTRDEVYLCARPLSAGADILGSISWRELN